MINSQLKNEQNTENSSRIGLSYSIIKTFIAVEDANECTASIIADKNILELARSSKSIIEADSVDENEVPVPTSSEVRNIMKRMRNYLEAHFNDEVNKKNG
ncbi:hypothetical protein TNCV_3604021 [Trichonephila clavipes]|nr:hypothetical protein TNCV_3604021 [Trichonephila clavipes]